MSLEERAREFVDREVFTDGLGRNAGRLVMEFDAKIPGTGWGKGPIVNKFVAFAASEVRAERARIAARLMDLVLQTREQYWGQQIADALNGELEAKLASAKRIIRDIAVLHVAGRWDSVAMVKAVSRAAQWLEENV